MVKRSGSLGSAILTLYLEPLIKASCPQIDFPLVSSEATYFPNNKLEQNSRNYFHSYIFTVPCPSSELVTSCSLAKTPSPYTSVGGHLF